MTDQRPMPELDGVEHEYVQAGDVKIHVAVAGPADGEPTLLVHGWPENWWMWHKVIPALVADGRRVYAMDLRGAGWSEVTPRGYEKEQFATDVIKTADALGLKSFDLIGHDWGGWTAQLAALQAPERVRRLILLNISPIWFKPAAALKHIHKLLYQYWVGAPVVGPLSQRLPVMWVGLRKTGVMPAESVAFFRECFKNKDRSIAGSKIYRTFAYREALPVMRGKYKDRHLTMPVRMLFGLDDVAVHPSMLTELANHAADSKITEVPGVGHFIVDEQPDLVIGWLREVLAEPVRA